MKRNFALLMVIALLVCFTACNKPTETQGSTCWSCGKGISTEDSLCEHCGVVVNDDQSEAPSTADTTETTTNSDSTVTTVPSIEETQPSELPIETQKPTDPPKPTEPQKPTETPKPTDPPKPTEPQKPTETQKPTHTHSYSKNVTAATCTQQGYTMYTCSCGDSYTADQTNAKGHSYTQKVTAPTCTEKGYTTYTCSCGDTYTDNYTDSTHNYSNYKCTICGTIDKANAYGYLMSWVKENGIASSGYTRFMYNSGSSTYMLVYSAQYNSLSVDKATVFTGGDVYMSLSLDSYYYGCTAFDHDNSDLEMCGYINASTFTSNSAISYTVFNGNANYKSFMMEQSRMEICSLIEWLDWCLDAYNVGITIKDLGFNSY